MKILMVLTSQKIIANTNKETGFHFSEFTHPYDFFIKSNYEVMVASPLGGECSITSLHPEDKINSSFYNDPEKMKIIKETIKLSNLKDIKFDAVYIAGGNGAMFDFPNNTVLADILLSTYENGGVLAAVCHGPAAFVGVKNEKGDYIVNNKKINSFTDVEEKNTEYLNDMPFLLESKLVEQGAEFESSLPREPHLAVDKNIVTGQNPESVELVIGAIHALLQNSR